MFILFEFQTTGKSHNDDNETEKLVCMIVWRVRILYFQYQGSGFYSRTETLSTVQHRRRTIPLSIVPRAPYGPGLVGN